MANLPSKRQKIKDGYGCPYHRVYSVKAPLSIAYFKRVMREIQTDINQCSPQILARFEKLKGHPKLLRAGDEFQIHITGPWNGPVRVIHTSETEFKLETLEGHPEAGEIKFSVKSLGRNRSMFEVESFARSRDAVVDFFYDKIPIAKKAQTEMWLSFCKKFAELAIQRAGNPAIEIPEVEVLTEKRNKDTGRWQKI